MMQEKELTILIPCLNEEATLEICIKKAKSFLRDNNIIGEIIIADNGSTDHSKQIAKNNKTQVVEVKEKGYGNVLRCSTKKAQGRYVIFGDADDSYNFLEIMPILESLRTGADFVIGNRFAGKIEKGAMPFTHRYFGTPVLSWLVRKKYKVAIKDVNCGLRGYQKNKILQLNCSAEGMEYASEMIIKAKEARIKDRRNTN